jgi:hypothetical protein
MPWVMPVQNRATRLLSEKVQPTSGDPVLFHVTQVHTPDQCPRDEGGSNSLFDTTVPGTRLVGRYGANAQHTLFLVVEADDVNALHRFLWPGFQRCTSTITPVSEVPVPKG